MIVYGWRSVQTAQDDIGDCNCTSCRKSMTLSSHMFHSYVHVFWIPILPIGRKLKSHCSACGLTLEKKEMIDALKLSCNNMRGKNRIPVWMFSGLIIIGALISWGFIDNELEEREITTFISNPLKGDVYEIKSIQGAYTTYKVETIAADSIYLLLNEYETNQKSDIDALKSMEYNDTAMVVLRSDLEQMLRDGNIIGVDRN